ncbi:S16 family serine protease [Alkalicoccus luteus]|uniref:S16 family serine protease n=1 Tax=Alkalicoccus luteus TaxID=1237094 RepID=UPI004034394D
MAERLEQTHKATLAGMSLLLTAALYIPLLMGYLSGAVGAFFLNGGLLAGTVVWLLVLITFRQHTSVVFLAGFAIGWTALLLVYEMPLVQYESHTYMVTTYREPEDVTGSSNIYVMAVGTTDVFILDEEAAVESVEAAGSDVFDTYETTNRTRYGSKNRNLMELFGPGPGSQFADMQESVQTFPESDVTEINSFFERDSYVGNSAGLALVLTGMSEQGFLQVEEPVSVTGAIEPDGTVTPVSMIEEKLLIAERDQIPLFIVPSENKAEAQQAKVKYGASVAVEGAATLEEAVNVINGYGKNGQTNGSP